eukprot:scaffold114222_cov63-Phaeocystis_antarctica.AAC.3
MPGREGAARTARLSTVRRCAFNACVGVLELVYCITAEDDPAGFSLPRPGGRARARFSQTGVRAEPHPGPGAPLTAPAREPSGGRSSEEK